MIDTAAIVVILVTVLVGTYNIRVKDNPIALQRDIAAIDRWTDQAKAWIDRRFDRAKAWIDRL